MAHWPDEESEYFISLVRNEEILWKKAHKDYYRSDMKHEVWKTIVAQFEGVKVHDVIRHWESLVRRFRRHKKLYIDVPTSSAKQANHGRNKRGRKSFPFFPQMEFLLENGPNENVTEFPSFEELLSTDAPDAIDQESLNVHDPPFIPSPENNFEGEYMETLDEETEDHNSLGEPGNHSQIELNFPTANNQEENIRTSLFDQSELDDFQPFAHPLTEHQKKHVKSLIKKTEKSKKNDNVKGDDRDSSIQIERMAKVMEKSQCTLDRIADFVCDSGNRNMPAGKSGVYNHDNQENLSDDDEEEDWITITISKKKLKKACEVDGGKILYNFIMKTLGQ
ncbi:hypothetical protein DMENIID0001_116100 [Sergentomyia squamirostris]